jgi:hypothetical protein
LCDDLKGHFGVCLITTPQNPLDLLFRLEAENRAERRRRTQCASSFCGFGNMHFSVAVHL